jgi:putative heme-binding domain-containing protein
MSGKNMIRWSAVLVVKSAKVIPETKYSWNCLLIAWGVLLAAASGGSAQTLHEQLAAVGVTELAQAARQIGDAQRGAVVFYQPQLACTRCHVADNPDNPLGPDLTKLDKDTTDEHLVESVLQPSKVIRKGFEPFTLQTKGGQPVSGILVSDNGKEIVIRDAVRNFKVVTFNNDDLEGIGQGTVSIMPEGQVNLLTSRQQFLDLVRYLIDIRDGGAVRARDLQPPPSFYSARPLPAYEQHIDHAGIMGSLDGDAFRRGQQIYSRLCMNCHGTHDQPGSLPMSLKFASDKLKNGNDPYSIYQTLTRGFGMMTAQTWMVPTEKYDVIHYIRQAYLKEHNPSQYFEIDEAYLARLPTGDTQGPAPSTIAPWEQMDYGPNLVMTLEVGSDGTNFAYKGNAIRLDAGPGGVSQGRYWMVYDYDTLRVAAAWSGEGFCDFRGINFNDEHNIHPRIVGQVHVTNPTGPGWGRPGGGDFEDVRLVGRDGRRYGPLPRHWAHYKGMYYHGPHTIIEYTVGDTNVLEMPGVITASTAPVFTRIFNIGPRRNDLVLQVAHHHETGAQLAVENSIVVIGRASVVNEPQTAATADATISNAGTDEAQFADGKTAAANGRVSGWTVAGIDGMNGDATWCIKDGNLRLKIPTGQRPLRFTLWLANVSQPDDVKPLADSIVIDQPSLDLAPLTKGGPARWPQVLTTDVVMGEDGGPFAVDVLTHPADNPWFCRLRLTGFDFTPDGNQAVVSEWDGSIWLVSGLKQLPDNTAAARGRKVQTTWRRIASGLFQPLGVKVVHGKIYVTCRDQLCVLHDLNGDDEIDYFENFNNDHQVTDHFHEFAMGLQADEEGNFYYAKSARHALPALVPHHGTLLRVSRDGSRTDILATGFRAANGVCLNPDGTFIVTDQEGHWNPKNRINYVKIRGFYGNMFGYHHVTDSSDQAMEQPLCWITNAFDRSPGELLWVDSPRWGPLNHQLLNLSYGYGKVFIVPHDEVGGQKQGGMCELPIEPFPTGTMRGRFHPTDGQLYLCGMFAWAGSQTQPGGFYRLRYTGKPVHLPVELHATKTGMTITFSGPLDPQSASDADNYHVKVWDLKRTENYGSDHYNERPIQVTAARLAADGRTVQLEIPDIAPTWCMEIRYRIHASDGNLIDSRIHNTIHQLSP